MAMLRRIQNGFKAFFELGPKHAILYLIYQLGLRCGYLKLRTPADQSRIPNNLSALKPNWFFSFPSNQAMGFISNFERQHLVAEAEQIQNGKATLFSCVPFALDFKMDDALLHWTEYEKGSSLHGVEDIKLIWEPSRFDWAIKLACAYHITKNDHFVESFWQYFEQFSTFNHLNRGVNWISGQEIALRLINWVITGHLIQSSEKSTQERLNTLTWSIAEHADRISRTMIYARAQNNNHLISEAAGLITASIFLTDHPDALRWQRIGIRWFNKAIASQITNNGEYTQHSTNYHRMMLMLALWVSRILEMAGIPIQHAQKEKLAAASRWLAAMSDPTSGRVPNLGHNDGTNILPFTNSNFDDYRPVIQASCNAFCGTSVFPDGEWNDLCHWLGIPIQSGKTNLQRVLPNDAVHRITGKETWAEMRAVHFRSRPAHADQLSVDLWHRGYNIAMDAGTYHYNLNPPWENALASTKVHNTITVNHQDQMSRISRFLWLDWAQAKIIEKNSDHITAVHDGYRHLGVVHQRKLGLESENRITITDDLVQTGTQNRSTCVTLQWLLPDWQFTRDAACFVFTAPFGEFRFEMISPSQAAARIFLVRGGIPIGESDESDPTHYGWYSPSYAVKQPALSIRYQINNPLPVRIISTFIFN
jgi:hypothetical protein